MQGHLVYWSQSSKAKVTEQCEDKMAVYLDVFYLLLSWQQLLPNTSADLVWYDSASVDYSGIPGKAFATLPLLLL